MRVWRPSKIDGVAGARALGIRGLGGNDYTCFSNAGLPGIGLVQDSIDYQSTWHTNLDTYERILEDDVKKDAVEIAWSVYQLATRGDLLPRFTKDAMPKPPSVETTTAAAPPKTKSAGKPRRTTRRRPNGAIRVLGSKQSKTARMKISSHYHSDPWHHREGSLTLWLLVAGVDAERWKEQAGAAGE